MIEISLKYRNRTYGAYSREDGCKIRLWLGGGSASDRVDIRFGFQPEAITARGAESSRGGDAYVDKARLSMSLRQAERLANALNAALAEVKARDCVVEATVGGGGD